MALEPKDLEQIAQIVTTKIEEGQEQFKKLAAETANSAVTAGLKKIRERLDQVPTKEEAAELAASKLASIEEERKAADANKGKDPKELENEELRKRLEAMERRSIKEAAEREEAKAREQRQQERSAVQDLLTKAGVIPTLVRPAIADLFDQKMVARDQDGAIVFVQRGEFGEKQLPLEAGIAAHLKTAEGLALLPPRKTGGSDDPKRPGGGSGGEQMKTLSVAEAAEAIRNL